MNRLLLFSVTLAFLATACTSKCTIKGEANLSQLSGKTIFLKFLDDNSNWVTLDSAEIVHGSFELNYPSVKDPQLVTLFMDCVPLTPLVLEPGAIHIAISASDLQIYGTPLNDRLYAFYKDNMEIERRIHEHAHYSPVNDYYETAVQAHQALIRNFMRSNSNNILGPSVYSYYQNQYPDLLHSTELESFMNQTMQQPNNTRASQYEIEATQRFKELEGFLFW